MHFNTLQCHVIFIASTVNAQQCNYSRSSYSAHFCPKKITHYANPHYVNLEKSALFEDSLYETTLFEYFLPQKYDPTI